MKKFARVIAIGAVAGIIDIIPMIAQHLNRAAIISAFVFWLGQGIVISYARIAIRPWLKGFLIAELCALPVMVLVAAQEPFSVVPITVMTAVLGSAVGALSQKFAGE